MQILRTRPCDASVRDKIRGSLIGGAAGDALGYVVEFLSLPTILRFYGEEGITAYDTGRLGKACFSDDTQMSLFTANGLLRWETATHITGRDLGAHAFVNLAYQDWYTTQRIAYADFTRDRSDSKPGGTSWLMDVEELFHRRAPGMTCLSALSAAREKPIQDDYFSRPRNDSKGCGGIMRVAPLGLCPYGDIEALDYEGARIAAITHGHPLGYLSAAVLVHIINRLVYPVDGRRSLKEIAQEARDTVCKLFPTTEHLDELRNCIDRAIELSENASSDWDNLHRLGEGWVAEETLAIALYCALRYEGDFSKGITVAVNHSGDSDSTGAVAGNILGAIHGYDAIEDKWKDELELRETMLELADDLANGCPAEETLSKDWFSKYVIGYRYRRPMNIFFWHDNADFGELSNWYESPFQEGDSCYRHVEQYIMASKAELFHDEQALQAIMNESSPHACKKLGRLVQGFDQSIWERERFSILRRGIHEKFTQNAGLMEQLLYSGVSLLMEASPFDAIYGIGLDAARAYQWVGPWPGLNLLGIALMMERFVLQHERLVEGLPLMPQ